MALVATYDMPHNTYVEMEVSHAKNVTVTWVHARLDLLLEFHTNLVDYQDDDDIGVCFHLQDHQEMDILLIAMSFHIVLDRFVHDVYESNRNRCNILYFHHSIVFVHRMQKAMKHNSNVLEVIHYYCIIHIEVVVVENEILDTRMTVIDVDILFHHVVVVYALISIYYPDLVDLNDCDVDVDDLSYLVQSVLPIVEVNYLFVIDEDYVVCYGMLVFDNV